MTMAAAAAATAESNHAGESRLFGRTLKDAELIKAMHALIDKESNLLFVDRLSPLALFSLNVSTLVKAMPEMQQAKHRYAQALDTRVMTCRMLEPLSTGQVWKARRSYMDTVSVSRLHVACNGRMIGISLETLYLAHVFWASAHECKAWPVISQASLTETFKDSSASGTAVPLNRLALSLGDHEHAPMPTPMSSVATVVNDLTTAATAIDKESKAQRRARAAAAAAAASSPDHDEPPKKPTFRALHAYLSRMATMTTRVDPTVHSVYVVLESPLFGYWLQEGGAAAANMMRANNNEARDVAKRSVAGDLWLIGQHPEGYNDGEPNQAAVVGSPISDNNMPNRALQKLAIDMAAKANDDAVFHAVALARFEPLAAQIEALDFCEFAHDFVELTLRISQETDDFIA